jgi:hypothetical protein
VPPKEILIRFSSTPPGAIVKRIGSTKVLGTTPFELHLPRQERVQEFEFSKPGYAPLRQGVEMVTDATFAVVMSPNRSSRRPNPRPGVRPKPTNTPSLDRNGTIDVLGGD